MTPPPPPPPLVRLAAMSLRVLCPRKWLCSLVAACCCSSISATASAGSSASIAALVACTTTSSAKKLSSSSLSGSRNSSASVKDCALLGLLASSQSASHAIASSLPALGFSLHSAARPLTSVGVRLVLMKSRAAAPSGTGSSTRLGKKNLSSRMALSGLSLPCVAFWVPSVPCSARRLVGASSRALNVLVGPISVRQSIIAFVFAKQQATIGPPDINPTSPS
mmetsp:Transcript_11197/g.27272  ORF Transcript_11197/g.27272 Transcript_11197/m.27272 type:complete len:222 (+) Transcript_11197:967-1632(+)